MVSILHLMQISLTDDDLLTLIVLLYPIRVIESASYFVLLFIPYSNLPFDSVSMGKRQKSSSFT